MVRLHLDPQAPDHIHRRPVELEQVPNPKSTKRISRGTAQARSEQIFSYAGFRTERILTFKLAMRAGKQIQRHRSNLKATRLPEVNPFAAPEFRPGWIS